jgi:acyl dehydratase
VEHDRTLPGGLRAGAEVRLGTVEVARERIKSIAAEFDPQPFHLDEEVAKASLFKSEEVGTVAVRE